MRLRLWHRLFFALAGLSIAALLAFAWLQQHNFRRGFLDYINQLTLERLAEPAQQLGEEYTRQGNWQFARGNERFLLRVLRMTAAEPADQPPAQRPQPPPPREDYPRPFDAPDFGPPPKDGQRSDLRRRERNRRMDNRPLPRAMPPRPAGPLDLASRVLLIDDQGQIVSGNPNVPRDSPALIIQSEGNVVGQLLVQPLPQLRGDIELAFTSNQFRYAAYAAVLIVLGALILAWALSRWLLAPIRALSRGTRALAAGTYAMRLPTTRQDELGELASDFNRLAGTLQSHQQARQQWGADIAHELRTPISILRGEIQALQDGVRQPGPETLASLHAECARLAALVDDLYELSLSDAGALSYRFENLDLHDVLRDSAAAHAGVVQTAGLELSFNALPTTAMNVRGDRQRLNQLFANVLGNALRYTDAPGQIRIEVLRENSHWCVLIDDSAPGVPEHALPRLFDRLYRVESSRSRAFGGAGLGLSICRNIVDAHGGRIDAMPSPLGGLRIRILLPIGEA